MLNRLLTTAIAVCALVLVGCEGSPVPLGSPETSTLDERFLGEWELIETTEDDDPSPELLKVFAFNASEYYVEYIEGKQSSTGIEYGDTLRTRIFLTELEGEQYANVQCINCDEDRSFFFFRVRYADDRLYLRTVDDKIYESMADMTTSRDAVDFLKAGLTSGVMLDEETAIYARRN